MTQVTVVLPSHLRTLAHIDGAVAAHPVLRGTIREHRTYKRRAFMRYFACEEDLSHAPPDTPLPAAVVDGRDVFRVVTAIAGG